MLCSPVDGLAERDGEEPADDVVEEGHAEQVLGGGALASSMLYQLPFMAI